MARSRCLSWDRSYFTNRKNQPNRPNLLTLATTLFAARADLKDNAIRGEHREPRQYGNPHYGNARFTTLVSVNPQTDSAPTAWQVLKSDEPALVFLVTRRSRRIPHESPLVGSGKFAGAAFR